MKKDVLQSKRPAPFGVRLTPEERADLDRRANDAGLSLGGYIKAVIFNTPPPRRSRRRTVYDGQLSALLYHLSRIGANVNRLTFIANNGSWGEAEKLQTVSDAVLKACQEVMGRLRHNDQFGKQPDP